MKKTPFAVLSTVAITLLALSAQQESQAAPSASGPTTTSPRPAPRPAPRLENQPPPSIAGFNFWGGGNVKPNAEVKTFALDIPIRGGGGSATRSGTLHVSRNGNTFLHAPFTITGAEQKSIPAADSVGLSRVCDTAQYDLHLEGSGFDEHKKAEVKATCSFSTERVDPWFAMAPDRIAELKKDHVFYSDVKVAFNLPFGGSYTEIDPKMNMACAMNVYVHTTVTNHLSHAVTGLRVSVMHGNEFRGSEYVTLAPGESKALKIPYQFRGEAGVFEIVLADPTNSAGGKIANRGYHYDISRTCSLASTLVP